MAIAVGVSKQLVFKKETTWGTQAAPTGPNGQALRRSKPSQSSRFAHGLVNHGLSIRHRRAHHTHRCLCAPAVL